MDEPLAYLNGDLIPASQAVLPVFDAGFVLGATVTEQLRTFRGELFRLPEHLARLHRSVEVAGLKPRESLADIAHIAERLAEHNRNLIDRDDDLGLCIFITPGMYVPMTQGRTSDPTVCLHTFPLPFALWSEQYARGASLAVTPVTQVPGSCWPADLKCRSRMHYYLADRQAAGIDPGARALLLDTGGFVSETATANVVAVLPGEGLVSPPRTRVLPGISLQMIVELAGTLDIQFRERDLEPDELAGAAEVLLFSTPFCLLPVTRLNGRPIGHGEPGATFGKLLAAWNQLVGFDIAAQARRFAQRA